MNKSNTQTYYIPGILWELVYINVNETQLIIECGKEHEELIKKIGRIKYSLPMINSYVIEVPEYKINSLRGAKGILSVHYNAQITAQSMHPFSNMKNGVSGGSYMTEKRDLSLEIPVASKPQGSARDAIHASKLQYLGYTGKGVSIAILDTGVAPVDDLTLPFNRIAAFMDFVNSNDLTYDDNGHGTHVAYLSSHHLNN